MLTEYGHRALLAGLVKPFRLRMTVGGIVHGQEFHVDSGYPRFGDTDPANTGRGTNVLSWAYTIPAGTDFGSDQASKAAMLDGDQIVYVTKLEAFRTSLNHPCKVYINIMLRKL